MQIVLEALKERHIGEISSEYGVHVSVVHRWKKELLEGANKVFDTSKSAKVAAQEKRKQEETIDNLYAQVGRLTTQLDWLNKNLAVSYPENERKAMVDWDISNSH